MEDLWRCCEVKTSTVLKLRIVVGEDGYLLAKSEQASWRKLTANTKSKRRVCCWSVSRNKNAGNEYINQDMNVSTVVNNGHRRVDEATKTKLNRRVGCSLVSKNKEAGNKHKDHDKNVSTVENSGHGRDEEVLVDG